MIVGEAPGEKEVLSRQPFSGASGWLLEGLLQEAGLHRSQAFLTNVCRSRPPGNDIGAFVASRVADRTEHHALVKGKWVTPEIRAGLSLLEKEVALCQPTAILALGNLALWALTGEWGIRKWRSSILEVEVNGHRCKVIPAYHPAAVLREWPLRGLLLHDIRRVKTELERGAEVHRPRYNFEIRPTFQEAVSRLEFLLARCDASPTPIASDIETRAGHTACIGFAWSRTEAICIPWMCVERPDGYWPPEQEAVLVELVRRLLSHQNAQLIWQNGAYDHQYEYRWHFVLPGLAWDTMLAHHAMFSISPKGLDHLSSLYCDYHRYWKDDGRLWDPRAASEDQLWTYNCEDCVRTFEIAEREREAIAALTPTWPRLPEVVDFQHRVQPVITKMMLRGVRTSTAIRGRMESDLRQRIEQIQTEIDYIAGQPLNINSPKQMTEYFYGTLAQSPIYARNPNGSRGGLTCDDDALAKIGSREPLLRPLIARIQALRSGTKFLSTYVRMPLDNDGRLRCSYNVAGTKTYRLASSENAFGSGGNLQNIPTGDESEDALIPLPNIRRLFLFDPDREGFDLDGDSADLRIVTGESGCRQMQAYFAAGAKPYVEIAKEFYRNPSITKHHSSYKRMKALCHGSNYGGEPAGLSERIGLPVHDIERMQKWYFGMCPEIREWQEGIISQFNERGYIENPFGYRLWRWDRPSRKLANEALAWTPQSTVGILINRIAVEIDTRLPDVELLLQVHDSLTGQYPLEVAPDRRAAILAIASSVEIPCRSGTIRVPAGIKTSSVSWGDCA